MTAAERAEVVSALGQKGRARAAGQGILERIGATNYAVVHVEFASERATNVFLSRGDSFRAHVCFFAGRLRCRDLAPDVAWVEEATKIRIPPPLLLASGAPTRGIPERLAQGGAAGYTGKGVILAISWRSLTRASISAILTHSFRPGPANLATPILLGYDDSHAYKLGGLGSERPLSYPNRTPVSTLYNWAQLTADLHVPCSPAGFLQPMNTATAPPLLGSPLETAAVRAVPSGDPLGRSVAQRPPQPGGAQIRAAFSPVGAGRPARI